MIRTFHPIGQGAFYTEKFNGYTIVYDCGSEGNVKLIEKEINKVFKPNQRLDAVFISHLDEDHVNGLEYLIKHCNVQRLFLPFLNLNAKIGLTIHYQIKYHKLPPFLGNSLQIQVQGNIDVIFVPEVEGNEQVNLEKSSIFIDEVKSDSLKSNSKIAINSTLDWVFIPYNFRQDKKADELFSKLKKEKLDFSTLVEFKRLWKNKETKTKIIDIYKSIPGGPNTNSMIIYSGPEIKKQSVNILYHYTYLFNSHSIYLFVAKLAGCIYWGDYDAKGKQKWNQFVKYYKDYWKLVGIVQIPHHGSQKNYNRAINKDNPKFSVISVGLNNKYGHPNDSTIRDILLDYGIPIMVTEDPQSELIMHINV